MPSTISGCYAEIRKYETLSSSISEIIELLNSNDKNYENLMINLRENYLINSDVTPVYDKVNGLVDDVDKTSNYLKNTILPAISSEIKALYRRIAELEAAEEAERKKEEEEKNNKSNNTVKVSSSGSNSRSAVYIK